MAGNLRTPLVPKEGYEGASAPQDPGYPQYAGPSGSSSAQPVTGYPVIGPSYGPSSAYPTIPPVGPGFQPYPPAGASGAHTGPVDAPPIIICRHDHHHCHPERAACGGCHRLVVPEPQKESGLCSFISAVGLCASGCWPCACLPFCCNTTKDTVYRCPNCSMEIYRRRAPFE
ncbi:hypothetical protein Agub_g9951 [Astrephomene gubernaculifera]|uniref:LITAF domain-containing protein n=1 Tax=Astrephomene gubernaculifera TaxID=47775 RepID=A0AAD3HNN7_9CHLO|nr:hypothetical protein Agub_g9951 [Astrephomene gubernaculifera]